MENIQPINYITNRTGDLGPLENLNGRGKVQLKKVAQEFEAIFIAKMLTTLDKTVDRENSLFEESKFQDNFKSLMFNDLGRQIASSPHTSIGLAKQLYQQMERTVPD